MAGGTPSYREEGTSIICVHRMLDIALVFLGDQCHRPHSQVGHYGCLCPQGSGDLNGPGMTALDGSHCAMWKSQPSAPQLENQHLLDNIQVVSGGQSLRNGRPKRRRECTSSPALTEIVPPRGWVLTPCPGITGSGRVEVLLEGCSGARLSMIGDA